MQICKTSEYRVGANLWGYVGREHGTHAQRKQRGASVGEAPGLVTDLEVTDAKDRVFAMLGLMRCTQSASSPPELTPDYSKTKLEVSRSATRYALQGGIPHVFSRIHHWTDADVHDEDWPSWVPRFDRDRCGNSEASSLADFFRPESEFKQAAIFSTTEGRNNKLFLWDVSFDTIGKCTSIFKKGNGLKSRQTWIQEADQIAITRNITRAKLAHTLIAGSNADVRLATTDQVTDFEAWMSHIFEREEESQALNSLPPNASIEARSAAKFEFPFGYASNNRRVFSTSGGRLGVSPSMLKKSDIVAILHGGNTPFILRRVESGYRVLGQCYVYGIMRGEAMQEQPAKNQTSVRFDIR